MAVTVCCRPSRSKTTVIGLSRLPRMATRTSSHVFTRFPATEMSSSPGLRPAALAGATGMSGVHASGVFCPAFLTSTHSLTLDSLGVTSGRP